ncbi:hypothetical protein [Streptomyces sp. YIM B13518]
MRSPRVSAPLGRVPNTSIGPMDDTWPAGPRLGEDAEAPYRAMSEAHGGR